MNKMKNDFRNYATKHLNLAGTTVDDVVKHQISSYYTPMVLEERALNVTQLSVFDRLLFDRILWVSGVVDEQMCDIIQAQLLYLESTDRERDITMMLSSPGGSVANGLGIRDLMNYVSPDIAVTNMGLSASMGSILLSSGKKGKRNSLINSRVMIHRVSSTCSGVIDDQRISTIEAEKYNYMLFKILAENCGKTFDEVYDIANRDKWFNSQEALNFGLIDEIIGVDKNKSITQMIDGFEDYYQKHVVSMIK